MGVCVVSAASRTLPGDVAGGGTILKLDGNIQHIT